MFHVKPLAVGGSTPSLAQRRKAQLLLIQTNNKHERRKGQWQQ